MSMKSLYNWFTQKAEKQFTLGQSIMGLDGYELTNGERAIERGMTGAGLLAGAIVLATTPFGLAALTTAIGYVAIGKASGLITAAFAKAATRGIEVEPALVPIRVQSQPQHRR